MSNEQKRSLLNEATPGDWMALSSINRSGHHESAIVVRGGIDVSSVYGETLEECSANARLIAAAKDMAEALQGIASADYKTFARDFDSAEEFVKWAKSRATFVLKEAGIE